MGGRFKIMVVLFALAAVIGAGCGGDDETTSTASTNESGSAANGSASSGSAPGDSAPGGAEGGAGGESGGAGGESGGSGSPSGGSGGASGDSASGEGSSLSRAEFIAQGNQICLDARSEIGEEIKALIQENQGAQGAAALDTAEEIAADIVIPHFKVQNEELRELPIPPGDEPEVEAFLDNLEGEVEKAEADTSVLLGSNVSPFLASRKLAIKYGLTKCGRI